MPRRRSFPALRQGQRRKSLWISGPDETQITTVAAGSADLQSTLNAAALALVPFTIVRTVGHILVLSDQTAAPEVFHGAYGMEVVSIQAGAGGTGTIPTPITEQSSDMWVMYQLVSGAFQTSGGTQEGFIFEFDSRGMRKVEDGETVVTVFENGSGTAGIDYLARLRFLVKLH